MIFSFSLYAIPLQVALVIYFGLEWLSLLEDGKCVIANTEIYGVMLGQIWLDWNIIKVGTNSILV